MRLLILCIDGHLDPDHPSLPKFPRMRYELKLSVPQDLYRFDQPSTLLVWPSIFAGKVVYKDWNKLLKRPTRLRFRQYLKRKGLGRFLKKIGINHKPLAQMIWEEGKTLGTPWGRIVAYNYDVETVFSKYDSVTWNIPTLDPEFIFGVPLDKAFNYRLRMFKLSQLVADGMSLYPYDLGAVYTAIIDWIGHNIGAEEEERKEKDHEVRERIKQMYEDIYMDVHYLARRLGKRVDDVMIVSDHGCVEGHHTHHAYLGCTSPIYAETVLDVRKDIERILNSK